MKYFLIVVMLAGVAAFLQKPKRRNAIEEMPGSVEVSLSNESANSNEIPKVSKTSELGRAKLVQEKVSAPQEAGSSELPQRNVGIVTRALASESELSLAAQNPTTTLPKRLEKLSHDNSKFSWNSKSIDKNLLTATLAKSKTPEQVNEILAKLPDSYPVLQAAPGEVKLGYDQVKVLTCPRVPDLKSSLVVRFDTDGIPVDVEWESPRQEPVPDFVHSCRFAPVTEKGQKTAVVFIWPNTAIQDLINHSRTPTPK